MEGTHYRTQTGVTSSLMLVIRVWRGREEVHLFEDENSYATCSSIAENQKIQLERDNPLYYDEQICLTIDFMEAKSCGVHIQVSITGKTLQDKFTKHILQEKLDLATAVDIQTPKGRCHRWTLPIHIGHPRSRLNDPNLSIIAVAMSQDTDRNATTFKTATKRYGSLIGLKPVYCNDVFAALYTLDTSPLVNLHSIVSKVSYPVSKLTGPNDTEIKKSGDSLRHDLLSEATLKNLGSSKDCKTELYAPLQPAVELSLRAIRPMLERDKLVTQLDLHNAPGFAQPIKINKLDVELENGTVAEIRKNTLQLPIYLDAGEVCSFCFFLKTVILASGFRNLSIHLEFHIKNEKMATAPLIRSNWTTVVDFEETLGAETKFPTCGPGRIGIDELQANISGSSLSITPEGSKPNRSGSGGLTFEFTGPNVVPVNSLFEWSLKVINKSGRQRRLVLSFHTRDVPQNTSQFLNSRVLEERPLISDLTKLRKRAETLDVELGSHVGVLPLCSELRIGTLGVQSCFEANISLLAQCVGTHTVETSSITDLTTGEVFECGRLLEVVVTP